MSCRFKTVAFDSASELARLFFSRELGKTAWDTEKIRAVQNYAGVSERLNMLVRRCKNLRDKGVEVVFTAHEDIQKVYARGGIIATKGQSPSEPIAVKGQIDMPGQRTPDEFCRAADNVLRVRYQMGKPVWIARREQLSSGSDFWEVKDRFNGPAINTGVLPPSYGELAKLAKTNVACNWSPAYIWMLYGAYGIGKTRSLLTFPRPLLLFNLDFGQKSIEKEIREDEAGFEIYSDINPEEGGDYDKFIAKFASLF